MPTAHVDPFVVSLRSTGRPHVGMSSPSMGSWQARPAVGQATPGRANVTQQRRRHSPPQRSQRLSAHAEGSLFAYEPPPHIHALETLVAGELAELERVLGCELPDMEFHPTSSPLASKRDEWTQCDVMPSTSHASPVAELRSLMSTAQFPTIRRDEGAEGAQAPLYRPGPHTPPRERLQGAQLNRLQQALASLDAEVAQLEADSASMRSGDAGSQDLRRRLVLEREALVERRGLLEKAARLLSIEQ
jgi:hypothetical protein